MTRLLALRNKPYGEFADLRLDFGERLTVVYGANEAGKSTALDALTDFLWGIPTHTVRASSFSRAKLVLEADLCVDGQVVTCVRRASGLVDAAGAPLGSGPWNPDAGLDRDWWRVRFGIDHTALRAGGSAVLAATQGARDISDLIFVARSGEVAHTLRETLSGQLGRVYASDGRRRSALRDAWSSLDQCREALQATLMRAGDVDQQRGRFEAADRAVQAATTKLTEAQSGLNLAEAHARAIDHVLAHVAAETELAELDAVGPRLDPDELARYGAALADVAEADAVAAAARGKVEGLQRQIEALAVDPSVLGAADEIDALARGLQARLEDQDKLVGVLRPAAEAHEAAVRELLTQLGADLSEGVEAALGRSRVRADLATTLDGLAGDMEKADQERGIHRANRQGALGRLADRGVLVDLAVSRPASEADLGRAKLRLRTAHEAVDAEEQTVARLRGEIDQILRGHELPGLATTLSRADVAAAREARDVVWDDIRHDWCEGPDRTPQERRDLADRFGELLRAADDVGDREASEREGLSARRAVAEMNDERVRSLGCEADEHERRLGEARTLLASATEGWTRLWGAAGIVPAPAPDSADLVLGDLILAHKESAAMGDAEERLRELREPWGAIAADAGLPVSATPATWRARSAILATLDRTRGELEATLADVRRIEQRWQDYQRQALAVFEKLAPSSPPPADPYEVGAAVKGLRERLGDQREHQARAVALQEQLDLQREAERVAVHQSGGARAEIEALRVARQVDDEGLGRMAELARRAVGPLQRMEAQLSAVRNAWPEAVAQDVIRSLRDVDRATVEAHLSAAQDALHEAQAEVGRLREERATEQTLLQQAEGRHGADESLGRVRQAEASVTDLVGKWLQLRLQVELLNRVIERRGDEGALPLLVTAGQILERFTAGRWVALQPTPGHGPTALRVVRADGLEAKPGELSEGTLDQVYLALRLAAVGELHRQRQAEGRPALPLVLDDVLMAFDDRRSREALTLLAELATDGLQIIVFTHHAYVAEEARHVAGAHVTELPPPPRGAAERKAEDVRAAASRRTPAPRTGRRAAG